MWCRPHQRLGGGLFRYKSNIRGIAFPVPWINISGYEYGDVSFVMKNPIYKFLLFRYNLYPKYPWIFVILISKLQINAKRAPCQQKEKAKERSSHKKNSVYNCKNRLPQTTEMCMYSIMNIWIGKNQRKQYCDSATLYNIIGKCAFVCNLHRM